MVKPTEDFATLSIKNYRPDGARALAEVVSDQGVAIRQAHSLKGARIADPAHTTLFIADGGALLDYQVDSILAYPGDVVVINPSYDLLASTAPDVSTTTTDTYVVDADCTDPEASVAGTVTTNGNAFIGSLPDRAVGCFSAEPDSNAMIVVPNGRFTVTLLADAAFVTNGRIAQEGNAALAVRLAGRHSTAVWYLNTGFDTSTLTWYDPTGGGDVPDPSPSLEFFPPGTGSAIVALLLSLVAVALWRGRRFGALVTEPLPVVIRSSEATAGTARLYRVARAYGRASASLRAGAASRMGKRLGITRTSDKEHLINAITRATGRPSSEISSLLYGPPPTSESAMMELIAHIDTIEEEVHRP